MFHIHDYLHGPISHYFKNKEDSYDNYVALLSMSNLYQILVKKKIRLIEFLEQ